jgi:ribosome-binding protein aMBF1 (putative translation factor)
MSSKNTFLPGTGKKIDENDIPKIDKVGIKIGKQITQARVEMGLKQKDVAHRMNLPVSVIQNHENGKAPRNNGLLSKFEKFFGKKFNR